MTGTLADRDRTRRRTGAARRPGVRAAVDELLPPRRLVAGGVLAAIALLGATLGYLMEYGAYETWAAIPVSVGLLAVSIPLLRRAAAAEEDPWIGRLLWWAFALKVAAALPRYVVAFGVYDGSADAAGYSRVGAELARQFRAGDFSVDIGKRIQGTGFIEVLTGAVYAVTGATTIGGFLVFSWFGFWGLYLFHRAFVRACPEGDHRRHALLVLLLPSLLFWPSSIGKEAWMCLFLGVVTYGAARVLTRARGGLLLIAGGSLALGVVRPHVAALLGFAVLLAVVARRTPVEGRSIFAPFAKVALLVVLGLGMVYAVGQLETFFGVDRFDLDAVQTTLDEVQRRTGKGTGSVIADSDTDLDPSRFPAAFANVMFRPYPWQATNLQSLISSAESLFLMGLLLAGWRRVLSAIRSILRQPYVVLCATYTVLFVYGFSSFSNAGILVRQRVQVLPFVLALLCLPAVSQRARPVLRRAAGRS